MTSLRGLGKKHGCHEEHVIAQAAWCITFSIEASAGERFSTRMGISWPLRVVEEALRTCRMRICAFCALSNHWHFVVWPEADGDLPAFMQQMTNMHVKRWKEHRHEIGYGHLYQGRHKSFPVETEGYFYQVVRYVERNALRANLVTRAEEWPWSSLRRGERDDAAFPLLSSWPLPRPVDWLEIVNQPQSEAELDALRRCVHRGSPYGSADWTAETAKRLRIESTLRGRGRPKKES